MYIAPGGQDDDITDSKHQAALVDKMQSEYYAVVHNQPNAPGSALVGGVQVAMRQANRWTQVVARKHKPQEFTQVWELCLCTGSRKHPGHSWSMHELAQDTAMKACETCGCSSRLYGMLSTIQTRGKVSRAIHMFWPPVTHLTHVHTVAMLVRHWIPISSATDNHRTCARGG